MRWRIDVQRCRISSRLRKPDSSCTGPVGVIAALETVLRTRVAGTVRQFRFGRLFCNFPQIDGIPIWIFAIGEVARRIPDDTADLHTSFAQPSDCLLDRRSDFEPEYHR